MTIQNLPSRVDISIDWFSRCILKIGSRHANRRNDCTMCPLLRILAGIHSTCCKFLLLHSCSQTCPGLGFLSACDVSALLAIMKHCGRDIPHQWLVREDARMIKLIRWENWKRSTTVTRWRAESHKTGQPYLKHSQERRGKSHNFKRTCFCDSCFSSAQFNMQATNASTYSLCQRSVAAN